MTFKEAAIIAMNEIYPDRQEKNAFEIETCAMLKPDDMEHILKPGTETNTIEAIKAQFRKTKTDPVAASKARAVYYNAVKEFFSAN